MNITRSISCQLLVLLILAVGCKTVEQSREPTVTADTDSIVVSTEGTNALQQLLNKNRSRLSDVHISQRHDMPNIFLKEKTSESFNRNPYDGYRIQIISTRNQPLADSVASAFRIWADTTIAGYSANAYISFKQPYYKVHVGDFQQRDRANSFSRFLKKQYPDAWVVHDRIDPSNVPADTASFSFKKPDAEKKKQEEENDQQQ